MKRHPGHTLLATTILIAIAASVFPAFGADGVPAEPQEVQVSPMPLPRLAPLEWRLPRKYATLDGNRLVVDIPADAYPADAVVEADLPADLFADAGGFSISISAKGQALAKPTKSYLGLKFQMHWREKKSGRQGWPNCRNIIGDFSEQELRTDASFSDARPDTITLMLGLQSTTGHVEFDLSTLCGAPSPGLFRLINQDFVVRYPNEPDTAQRMTAAPSSPNDGALRANDGDAPRQMTKEDNAVIAAEGGQSLGDKVALVIAPQAPVVVAAKRHTPLRGCMLPARATTEDDMETLYRWGATMARFQIVRNWSGNDDNQDIVEYAKWMDSRLDNLEDVLRWARARGMKIVVDVHVPPGGKRPSDREMNMFHSDVFAEAWIDTWRRIATRLRGNHDVIYGYDLINEPHQHDRVRNDYWSLQRRAAEVVRAIDPNTPIVFESNGSDAPATFAYLSPLHMDNVIYQVHVYAPMAFTHQGVHGSPVGAKWPDPEQKWDIDFLRETLRPVREFEKRHHAKIYVGEFSAIAWADGAENYIRDCITLFEEYGWDWTYHAFREWNGWSVEHEGPDEKNMVPSADNPRKRALLDGFARP